jgi:large subunit ribosomal protein L30
MRRPSNQTPGPRIAVRLVRSPVGRPETHRRILRGMGLTRVGKTVVLLDRPEVRGMIHEVTHLVEVTAPAGQ